MAKMQDTERGVVKSCSAEARQDFHRKQMANPDVLMPDLDPDPPISLPANLTKFENAILVALQIKRGSKSNGLAHPSKDVRPTVLARKIASGSGLGQADIGIIAKRIGWLQRNWFRRRLSNGYQSYFASRSAKRPSSNTRASPKADKPDELIKPTDGRDVELKASVGESPNPALVEKAAILTDIEQLDASSDPSFAPNSHTDGSGASVTGVSDMAESVQTHPELPSSY
jgi:hypothetical protein